MCDSPVLKLERFGPLEEDEQVEAFVDLVWEVGRMGDPAAMDVLLGHLDDECPFAGIMSEVVKVIEAQPNWIVEFIRRLPKVNESSENHGLRYFSISVSDYALLCDGAVNYSFYSRSAQNGD